MKYEKDRCARYRPDFSDPGFRRWGSMASSQEIVEISSPRKRDFRHSEAKRVLTSHLLLMNV